MSRRGIVIGEFGYPLSFRAVIEDSVHGAIRVTTEEFVLLQTPFLRRLHEIKQLGLAYLVFPAATHSRLEHSLGSTQLMYRIASRIASKAMAESRICSSITLNCSAKELKTFIEIARLAALLHDLGHLPFSHTTEEALHSIIKECEEKGFSTRACSVADAVKKDLPGAESDLKIHEIYTLRFVKELSKIVEGENPELSLKLRAAMNAIKGSQRRLSASDIEELGLREEASRLISRLLSHEIFDVDRVDYLVRDARYTGVVYGYIDLDRLIEGLDIEPNEDEIEVMVSPKAIPSIEDVFDARFKMYRTVYFHHKILAIQLAVAKTLELMLEEWWTLNPQIYEELGDPSSFLKPDRLAELIGEGRVYFDDSEMLTLIKLGASRGSKKLKRWAKSLLHERHLLPVSLIKRTEEILGDIPTSLIPVRDLAQLLADIDFEQIAENSILREITGTVRIYGSVRRIVNPEELKSLKLTHYLDAVLEAGSIPVVQVFVYSDDESTHRELYEKRWQLREAFKKALVEEIGRSWRR